MTINYALSDLVLPPTLLVLLTLLGVALLARSRRTGIALIVGSQLVLLALSTQVVANALLATLEPPPLTDAELTRAQAIVILGGGRNLGAPEYDGETVNEFTLARLRYGARLARASGLPVYVTGGRPSGGNLPEGQLMTGVLGELGVKPQWVDDQAATTQENAINAARDLLPQGLRTIALVTHGMHMPRSQYAFEKAGFQVIVAPTGYAGRRPFGVYQLVPGASPLRLSHFALRELVSQQLYRLIH